MRSCSLLLALLAIVWVWTASSSSFVQGATSPAAAPATSSPHTIAPPDLAVSSPVAAQAFPVANASDLAAAFQSRAQLIYLTQNITLTNDVFPSNLSLTIGQTKNISITAAPYLTSTVTLDFGYFLTERVTIASSSVLNLQNIQLLNYYLPSLDATPTDTFLPFFSVLPGAIINCTAVRFQIDPTRCSTGQDYANTSNSLRIPWLMSEYPGLLSWHTLDANNVQIDSARAPQNFERINASYVVPSNDSGDIEMSTCIFFCATTPLSINNSSSDEYSVAANGDELGEQLSQLDSRTIYIEDNITVGMTEWDMTIVIANSRQVVLQSALPGMPDSPGNDTVTSQLYIQDSSDAIEAGYGGNLTFRDLNLLFDSVCCSTQQLLGSWYINQKALAGSLFNDLLPAALNALPVHIVGLAPPALLYLENLQIGIGQCDSTRFPRIANSLINALNSNANSSGNATYSNGHYVACANCLFQGTAVSPTNFSNPASYSTVQLVNVTINCATFVHIALPPAQGPTPSLASIEGGAGSAPSSGSASPSQASSGSPPAAGGQPSGLRPGAGVVAGVIVAICAAMAAFVVATWALLQRDYRRLQASYGHLPDQSGESKDSSGMKQPLTLHPALQAAMVDPKQ